MIDERTRELSAVNEELKKLRDELRLVVDTIPTMAWSIQPDGAVDFVNQRWLDYSGLTLEEEVKDPTRVVHPEDLPRVMEKWRVDMAAGEPSEDEMRLQRADGEYRWFLVRTAPLRDERGNIVKWYGVSIDIEDRKRAAEAVRRSEAYLAAAQRLTRVGSWSLDLSAGELHWSAETFRIFSFEPAASADLHNMFLNRIHPGDRPVIEQGLKNALTITEPYEVEYRIVWPDGSVKAIRESVYPRLGKSGEVIERYGVVADITERKQAENDLRRLSGRLLQLQDEERRRIARDLHDSTGQDLVALATMLGQLRSSLPSSEQKSRKLLSECKALADRCIREVRTLSYVLYPPALEQAGLAGAIRDYVRGFTERSGIHVGLELSPHVGRMGQDVELALFRVVQEGLANIQRHSGSRYAKIRMAQIHTDNGADLVLEISDSGREASAGLSRHTPRLPFQFGVGIRSMQERANLIGGRLEINSTNAGTTVRMTIPLGDEHEKASHSIS
ncbi:MAG TPA: PAS domain-containing protein [Candidatus Acidoferrum sp.]|nr:PAS domain-containing protein [Candidatus Acidoferrum sp.]